MKSDKEKQVETEEQITESVRLEAKTVYEVIRREGEDELERPPASLMWSGFAAGIAMSSCVVAEGLLRLVLPDSGWRPLLENFGYCVGFLIVILGRLQLFTENTITPMLTLFANFSPRLLGTTARLWGIVLLANLAGTFLAAFSADLLGLATAAQLEVFHELSREAILDKPALAILLQGIPAGFYIAALVWMLPSAKGFEFSVIIVMTYLIAIGDYAHVVAGAMEVFLLLIDGQIGPVKTFAGYLLPALIGNIIGGTVLFSLLAYAQVRKEIDKDRPGN